MTYRSRPLGMRPDFWRALACLALLFCVLNLVLAGYSSIDGTGFPLGNLISALGFGVCGIFSLARARKLDR